MKPIVCSGLEVRAILEGRKTQARRVVKPQPVIGKMDHCMTSQKDAGWLLNNDGKSWRYDGVSRSLCGPYICPYGKPEDRLWVRETWGPCAGGVVYRSTCDVAACPDGGHWKPSIHMPRWASRITLEIESVRVERLQEISEEDAMAEGVILGEDRSHSHAELGLKYRPAMTAYFALWESINGPGSWDANLWVWVITFKRVQQT